MGIDLSSIATLVVFWQPYPHPQDCIKGVSSEFWVGHFFFYHFLSPEIPCPHL